MRYESLESADEVYATTAEAEATHLTARDDGVERFSTAVAALLRELGADVADAYWREPIHLMKKSRFALLSTPLPLNAPELLLLQRLTLLQSALENCSAVFPHVAVTANAACEALGELYMRDDNPLGEEIVRDCRDQAPGRCAVVLKSRGQEHAVRRVLAKALGFDIAVVSPALLAEKRPYDTLYVVGSPAWFTYDGAGWIFTAPRSRSLRVVSYECIRVKLPERRLFAGSSVGGPALAFRSHSEQQMGVADDDGDLLPTIDWHLMIGEIGTAGTSADYAQPVDAVPVVLAQGRGAFLNAEPGATVQVLAPDAAPTERIETLPVAEVVPGMYVLLRSEGAGDYLVALADRLLGDGAEPLRQMQREWKRLLQKRVGEAGIDATVVALKAAGCARASRANMRNWLSPRSLRTWDYSDFAAILAFVGVGDSAERYWAAMGKLDEAHQRAGFEIRKQLNKQAANRDLSNLDRDGGIDFTLPGLDAGTLTALRVEEVSADTVQTPPSRLNQPFELRGELWRG